MEKPVHVSDGFYFPATSSESSLSLRIQNHDWVVYKRMTCVPSYEWNNLVVMFQRSQSSEKVDFHLVLFVNENRSTWRKIKKSLTFAKRQPLIEVYLESNGYSFNDISLIGMISVCFPDSCKTDNKKSNVGSTSSSDVISSQLSKDFSHLLDSDVSSDYVLRCAGHKFHVHKCILAARSSVFAALFRFNKNAESEDPMTKAKITSNTKHKEAQDCTQETSMASNQAEDIMDIKLEILKKMLKYIYSGQVDDLTSTEAGDLLYAADKYQLDLLKKICVNKLKSTVSASNVLDILVIGDLHDESLKAHAMNFICEYPSLSELKKMDQWKSLQTTNPAMVIEVLTSVVGYLQDSKK